MRLPTAAELQGVDVQFKVDATSRTIHYVSKTISDNELPNVAKALVSDALLNDPQLRINSETLSADGQKLADAMTAKKGQISLDGNTKNLVNLIENEQLLIAIPRDATVKQVNGNDVYSGSTNDLGNSVKGVLSKVKLSVNGIPGQNEYQRYGGKMPSLNNQQKPSGDVWDNLKNGMTEQDVMQKLPPMAVEDMSDSFSFTPSSGGSKPAGGKSKGKHH